MKKVLILANSSKGVYSFRNELVVKLLEKYEVVVSVPDDVSIQELNDEGCKIIHTPMNRRGMNPFEDFQLMKSYRAILKSEKPDIVLTYTIKPNIYGTLMCSLMKIPYMTTITGLGSTFQKDGILKQVIIHLYRNALKNAHCVFFQNKQNMGIFDECRIKGKKTVLVNGSGVNLEEHQYEEYPQNDQNRFLFIGRIMKEKGIEEFLEAAKELSSQGCIFEILGYCDEDYQNTLDEYEKNGFIKQHGFRKDVKAFLKDASVLVLPTYHEGMSNVLMEASATGRPVIATNISGCKEIFEEGVTGFGCEPESVQSLVTACKRFLELSVSERAKMGRAARVKMEREFDRKLIVNTYLEEIDNVVK